MAINITSSTKLNKRTNAIKYFKIFISVIECVVVYLIIEAMTQLPIKLNLMSEIRKIQNLSTKHQLDTKTSYSSIRTSGRIN